MKVEGTLKTLASKGIRRYFKENYKSLVVDDNKDGGYNMQCEETETLRPGERGG